MTKTRLRWSGNQQAQQEADAAFRKLKPKVKRKKKKKRRHHSKPKSPFFRPDCSNDLDAEFMAIIANS